MSKGSNDKRSKLFEQLGSMNKNMLGMIICASILILTLVIAVVVRDKPAEKNTDVDQSSIQVTEDQKNGNQNNKEAEEYSETSDVDLSGVSTDTKKNKAWKKMTDETYGCEISAIKGGYSGKYVEDGTDEEMKDVLTLEFKNEGDECIQYAEYVYKYGDDTVSFHFTNLPAGQSCLVMESNRKEYEKKLVLELVSRTVVQIDELPFARDQVLVVDNNDDTITVMNVSDKEIPVARVFYKTFDSKEKVFVGGITYTASAEKIPAGAGVTINPEHYKSDKSKIVGSGAYKE